MIIMRSHTVSVGARHPEHLKAGPQTSDQPPTTGQPRTPTQRLDTTYRQLDRAPAVGEGAGSAGGMSCRRALIVSLVTPVSRRGVRDWCRRQGRDPKLIGPLMVPSMGLVRPCCWHRTRLSLVGLIRSLSAFGCDSSQSCRNVARAGIDVPSSQPRSELHAGSPSGSWRRHRRRHP